MKTKDLPVPASPQPEGGITIHNQLHPGHSYHAAIDDIFRAALRGLPGPWDASVYPAGRAWFQIDIVAPDGASWSTSVSVHRGPSAEDLADKVRSVCVRRCRLRPGDAKPADESGAPRSSPRADVPRGGVASVRAPLPREGTPK